jgi:hypothetical protein
MYVFMYAETKGHQDSDYSTVQCTGTVLDEKPDSEAGALSSTYDEHRPLPVLLVLLPSPKCAPFFCVSCLRRLLMIRRFHIRLKRYLGIGRSNLIHRDVAC